MPDSVTYIDPRASLGDERSRNRGASEWVPLVVAFAAIIGLQLYLLAVKSINWDEFFFFSRIQELKDGQLAQPLQTFYTRLFVWLRDLPAGPIDQLLAGRVVMFGCEMVAAAALFIVARRFASGQIAALCALTYLSAGFVFQHGFAFRADPLATALLMTALACLLRRRINWTTGTVIAVLLGLSAMITIKVVLYAPVFAGAAWLKLRDEQFSRTMVLRLIAVGVGAGASFAILYAWHSSGLAPAQPNPGGTTSSAWNTVFSVGLFPQGHFFVRQVLFAPHVALMLAAAPFLWPKRFKTQAERLAMAGFYLPLLTIIFYRNSYPYFFVFLLAPAMLSAIPSIEIAFRWLGRRVYPALLVSNALFLALIEPTQMLPAQRRLIDGVHQIFPVPVAYFDFCGMVGDFHRPVHILTSGWGLKNYRSGGKQTLRAMMGEQPVPLLVLNHGVLADAAVGRRGDENLLDADAEALRESYIPHWGPVWVAGKRLPTGTAPLSIGIAVPGTYTLEGAAVSVDGKMVAPGQTISLDHGVHTVVPNSGHEAVLRWGDHLFVPKQAAPRGYLFTDY